MLPVIPSPLKVPPDGVPPPDKSYPDSSTQVSVSPKLKVTVGTSKTSTSAVAAFSQPVSSI